MTHLGERFAWGGLGLEETMRINYKMSFIKDNFQRFHQHFIYTSHQLFFGLYILNHNTKNVYFWICLQNFSKRTSHYHGETNPWKTIATSNIPKTSASIFLQYFKNKYFLEMWQNMLYYTSMNNIYGILAYNGNSSKYFFSDLALT